MNCLSGSSGKKVSLREYLSDFTNGRGGGIATRCAHSTPEGCTGSVLPMRACGKLNALKGGGRRGGGRGREKEEEGVQLN